MWYYRVWYGGTGDELLLLGTELTSKSYSSSSSSETKGLTWFIWYVTSLLFRLIWIVRLGNTWVIGKGPKKFGESFCSYRVFFLIISYVNRITNFEVWSMNFLVVVFFRFFLVTHYIFSSYFLSDVKFLFGVNDVVVVRIAECGFFGNWRG